MKPLKTLCLAFFVALAVAPAARAALPMYMELTLNGEEVEGDVTQAGREGTIQVIALRHELLRQVASGRIGALVNKPLTITKPIDRSTPLMYDGIAKNSVAAVTIKFYQPSGTGSEQHFLTIELANATIVRVQPYVANTLDPAAVALPPMEEVTFAYGTMTVTHELSGNEAAISNQGP